MSDAVPVIAPGAGSRLADRRGRLGAMRQRSAIAGYLFISPWIVGLLVFTLYPIIASAYFSLADYSVLESPRWVGLDNYVGLFTRDHLFAVSVRNTLWYAVVSVPTYVVSGVTLALLLNTRVRGVSIYRTLFYLPSITPAVAMSLLWLWLLNPNYGLVNSLLDMVGINGPGWLTDPRWSKPSLVIMGLWGVGGAMIIYLAGLQDVPESLYEAASLDGANSLQKTLHVSVPMITPAIFFNLVMGLIGSFQYFTQVFVMTHGSGGPLDSTLFYCLLLYRNAFQYFKMGYASAMAWLLFIVAGISSAIVFRSSGRWVFYGGVK